MFSDIEIAEYVQALRIVRDFTGFIFDEAVTLQEFNEANEKIFAFRLRIRHSDKKPATLKDLTVGSIVMDCEGDVGTLIECDDAHNILVNYFNNATGLICISQGCEAYEDLIIL